MACLHAVIEILMVFKLLIKCESYKQMVAVNCCQNISAGTPFKTSLV